MRVEVEIPVLGWGSLKPGAAKKDIFASVPRVFDIPDYSISEVPVVLAYGEASRQTGKKTRTEYFGVGGKLYTDRMAAPDDDEARSMHYRRTDKAVHPYFAVSHERFVARARMLRKESEVLAPKKMIPAEFGEFATNGRHDTSLRIQTFQELGLKRYDEERVEKQIADFSKRMERMIVVGGNVMAEEQEPMFKIGGRVSSNGAGRMTGRVHTRPETAELVDIHGWAEEMGLAFVSLSRFDSLPSRVAALEERFGASVDFDASPFDIEIDDPRYLRASGEAVTMIAAADLLRRRFVDRMAAFDHIQDKAKNGVMDSLMKLEPGLLASVQTLASTLPSATEFDISEDLEQVVSEIMARHAVSDLGHMFGSATILGYVGDALQLYQDREVGLEIGVRPNLATLSA
jgi:hypothetical protein